MPTQPLDLAQFDYTLPPHLIARYPSQKRSESRMMHIQRDRTQFTHHHFHDLLQLLSPNDTLFINDSRVMRARIYAKKMTGAHIEILIEKMTTEYTAIAHIKSNKKLKIPTQLSINDQIQCTLFKRQAAFFHIKFDHPVAHVMQHHGHIPVPPYLGRPAENIDSQRYQTVYAKEPGSVAAPTAGLHFDEALIEKIKAKGCRIATITLHVGSGTFLPIRSDNIYDHTMHTENYTLSETACRLWEETKNTNGRVIAVGTTTARCLESAYQNGQLKPGQGSTSLFIYPGYTFHTIDGIITNFHLPKSSLLLLISAWCGYDTMKRAYQQAIENEYRFYSYGDAMLIT